MRPLQSVAMGLVIVGLTATLGGFDLLADPVGWVLVLVGLSRLPRLAHVSTLTTLATLALLVSAFLWVPSVREWLNDTDPSLPWAATLPQLACCYLLCRDLAESARSAGDREPAAWLRTLSVAFLVVAALPILVWGGGYAELEDASYVVAGVVLLVLVCLLFLWSGRPWAASVESSAPPDRAT